MSMIMGRSDSYSHYIFKIKPLLTIMKNKLNSNNGKSQYVHVDCQHQMSMIFKKIVILATGLNYLLRLSNFNYIH